MKIKEYLDKIKRYCSDEKSIADFINEFVPSITQGISTDFFSDNSTAEKFYNGTRFTEEKIKVIQRNLKKDKFVEYLKLEIMGDIESFKRAFGFEGDDLVVFGDLLYSQFLTFLEKATPEVEDLFEKHKTSCETANSTDPKRITVNNYGTVENQKFVSIEVLNGDVHL